MIGVNTLCGLGSVRLDMLPSPERSLRSSQPLGRTENLTGMSSISVIVCIIVAINNHHA